MYGCASQGIAILLQYIYYDINNLIVEQTKYRHYKIPKTVNKNAPLVLESKGCLVGAQMAET